MNLLYRQMGAIWMQENEVDHLIKINRWLYACARFIEASKSLTDYDIDGIQRVVDIMKSMAEKSQLKKRRELRFVPGHDSNISEEQKEEISEYIDFLPEKRQENQDIVRCNECVNYHEYKDWDRYWQESFTSHECKLLKRDFGADGYCSLGRRKKAANETD